MDVYNNNEEVIFEARTAVRPASFTGMCFFPVTFPFRMLANRSEQYTLTNERLTMSKGIIGKSVDEIELYRIVDTKVKQTLFQRMMGTGDILVQSDDMSGNVVIRNVFGAKQKREAIRAESNRSRKENNVRIHTS